MRKNVGTDKAYQIANVNSPSNVEVSNPNQVTVWVAQDSDELEAAVDPNTNQPLNGRVLGPGSSVTFKNFTGVLYARSAQQGAAVEVQAWKVNAAGTPTPSLAQQVGTGAMAGGMGAWLAALLTLILAFTLAVPAKAQTETVVGFTPPLTQLTSSVTIPASGSVIYTVKNFPMGQAWNLSLTNIGTTDPGTNVYLYSYQTGANVSNYLSAPNKWGYTWDVWLGDPNGSPKFVGLASGNGVYPSSCSTSADIAPGDAFQCLGGTASGQFLSFYVFNGSGTTAVTLELTLSSGAPNTELFSRFDTAVRYTMFPVAGVSYTDPVVGCIQVTEDDSAYTAGQTKTIYTFNASQGWSHVCGLTLSPSATDSSITVETGTGTTCGTGTRKLAVFENVTSPVVWNLPTNVGLWNFFYFPGSPSQICVSSAGAVTVSTTILSTP